MIRLFLEYRVHFQLEFFFSQIFFFYYSVPLLVILHETKKLVKNYSAIIKKYNKLAMMNREKVSHPYILFEYLVFLTSTIFFALFEGKIIENKKGSFLHIFMIVGKCFLKTYFYHMDKSF